MRGLQRTGGVPGHKSVMRLLVTVVVGAVLMLPLSVRAASGTGIPVATYNSGLNAGQQQVLYSIARQTWKFYSVDVDPTTHLPMDNIGLNGAPARGTYTSAANIGVYLWAVVAANDLGLISRSDAVSEITATLNEVNQMSKFDGFLYQWYDTTNGHVIKGPPNNVDCSTDAHPTFGDTCIQISQVDNGWYASGLTVVQSAFPELSTLVNGLMAPMNFGIFYDNGPESACDVYYNKANPNDPYNGQPTGQMYGVYFVGFPPSQYESSYYHNGAFYSDPRISAYMGMGLNQMPGNVWWRSWRVLPPKAPYTNQSNDSCAAQNPSPPPQYDPDFSWTGQSWGTGSWQDNTDPRSAQVFHVWEGHYTYPGDSSLTFVPTWAGGMFEGLMANEVVPETSWGAQSFGLNDSRWAQVQMKYATEQLHYPVWGMSPSSTPDDTGNYDSYGVTGLAWPYSTKQGLSQCYACGANGPTGSVMEDVITPHASFLALDVLPQEAFANIQALRSNYPDIYGPYGFFDAVAPNAFTYTQYPNGNRVDYNVTAGEVGHRYLVLDQSMIMAALDNALQNRALQRHFAASPVSSAAQQYLSSENMGL